MSIAHSLNQMRPPSVQVDRKKADDFNRPKVKFAGKTYEPKHPMYESIRRMILERYRNK